MAEIGQIVFTTAGTTSWVVPAGVTSICGVAVGPASRNTSSGGGGLSWRNNIPVTPGETLTIQIGVNQASSVASTHTALYRGSTILMIAEGANGINGGRGGKNANIINGGGGNGGNSNSTVYAGGGGAGGYTGDGGSSPPYTSSYIGGNGSGGGGGAGGSYYAAGGGGVGLMGQGANGVGGNGSAFNQINYGTGGSGGANGGAYINDATPELGGNYGGGSSYGTTLPAVGSQVGAMRLIWGPNRAFPSTGTADQDPEAPINLGRSEFTTGTNTLVVPAGANSAYLVMVGSGDYGGGGLTHGHAVVTPGETLTFIVDSKGTGVYGNREGNPLALIGFAHAAVGSAGGVAWRGGPYFKMIATNAGGPAVGLAGGGAAGYSAAGNSGQGGAGQRGTTGSGSNVCGSYSYGGGGGGVGLNGEGASGVALGAGGSGGTNGGNGTITSNGTCTYQTNPGSGVFYTGTRYTGVGGPGGTYGGGRGASSAASNAGAGGVAITFFNTILYGNNNDSVMSALDARDQEANLSTEYNSLTASLNAYTGPTSSNDDVLVTALPYESATSTNNETQVTALTHLGATSSNNDAQVEVLAHGELQIYSGEATTQVLGHGDLPDMTTNINRTRTSSLVLGDLQIFSQKATVTALSSGDTAADSSSNQAVTTALVRGDLQVYSNRARVSVLADNEINTVMFQVDERQPGLVSTSSTWMVTSDFVGKYRLDDSYACDVIVNGVLQTKAPGKILDLNLGDAIQFQATADSSYGATTNFTITGDNVLYVSWINKASNRMDYLNFGFYENVLPFTFTTDPQTVSGLDTFIDYEENPYMIFSRNARLQFFVNDSEIPVTEAAVVNGDVIRLYWRGPMPITFPEIVTYYLESTYQDAFYPVAEISSRAFELGDPFLRPDITFDFDATPEHRVTELVGLKLDPLTPQLTGVNIHTIQLSPVVMNTLSFWTQLNPILQKVTTQWTQTTPLLQKVTTQQTQMTPILGGVTTQWTDVNTPKVIGQNVQVTDTAFAWTKTTIAAVQNPDFAIRPHEKLKHGSFTMASVRTGKLTTATVDILVAALKTSSGTLVDNLFVKNNTDGWATYALESVRSGKNITYAKNASWDLSVDNPALFLKHWESALIRTNESKNIADKFSAERVQSTKLAIDHVYQNSYPQKNWLSLDAQYSRLTYSVWFTSYPEVPYLASRAQEVKRVPVDLNFYAQVFNEPQPIDHVYQLYQVDGKLHINDVWQWYRTNEAIAVDHKYDTYQTASDYHVHATYTKHLDSQSYYFQVEYAHTLQVTSRGVTSTFFEWTKAVRIPVGIGFEHVVYQSNYTFGVDYVTGPRDAKTYFIDYDFITRPHVTATVDNEWNKATEPSYALTSVTPTLADSKIITVNKTTGLVRHNIQVVDKPTFTLVRDPLTQVELLDGQAGYHTQQEAIEYAESLGFTVEQIRLFQYNGKYGFTTDPEAFAAVCRIEPPEDGISKVIFWR